MAKENRPKRSRGGHSFRRGAVRPRMLNVSGVRRSEVRVIPNPETGTKTVRLCAEGGATVWERRDVPEGGLVRALRAMRLMVMIAGRHGNQDKTAVDVATLTESLGRIFRLERGDEETASSSNREDAASLSAAFVCGGFLGRIAKTDERNTGETCFADSTEQTRRFSTEPILMTCEDAAARRGVNVRVLRGWIRDGIPLAPAFAVPPGAKPSVPRYTPAESAAIRKNAERSREAAAVKSGFLDSARAAREGGQNGTNAAFFQRGYLPVPCLLASDVDAARYVARPGREHREQNAGLYERGKKQCAGCAFILPVSDCAPVAAGQFGLDARCRECGRKEARNHARANRDSRVIRKREYRSLNPDKVRTARKRAAVWEKFCLRCFRAVAEAKASPITGSRGIAVADNGRVGFALVRDGAMTPR